jgi:molecular chaperone HscA
MDVKPSYGLADEQIARMLQDGFATAEQDMGPRAGRSARRGRPHAAGHAKRAGRRRRPAERRRTHPSMRSCKPCACKAAVADAPALEAATQALAKGTEAFAAQRMNRGIRKALAGQNVEDPVKKT